jgi:hypothetical protein
MRVAHNRCAAALDLTFEFADAAEELVVELLLLEQLRSLVGKRRLGSGEFFGEPCDERVLGASTARFGVSDPMFELFDVAEHSAGTLSIETEEVTLVNHCASSEAGVEELMGG